MLIEAKAIEAIEATLNQKCLKLGQTKNLAIAIVNSWGTIKLSLRQNYDAVTCIPT